MTKTDKRKPPKVDSAPGLTWRELKTGWEARWQARSDIAKKGFKPTVQRIWFGDNPTPTECLWIATRCQALQSEMLVWSRGGLPPAPEKKPTSLTELIEVYREHRHSPYLKLRHRTRQVYNSRLRIIGRDHGNELVSDIKGTDLIDWYQTWVGPRVQLPRAYYLVAMLRSLFAFGHGILEDAECARLSAVLGKQRYLGGTGEREERLTAEQVTTLRAMAHRAERPSIALAQAFQFELALRQKDVVGEWAPVREPGTSDIVYGQSKWLYGIRWSEIDQSMTIRHYTSKKDKLVEASLWGAPMVVEELDRLTGGRFKSVGRAALPATGPIIVNELTGRPYNDQTFRDHWRRLADDCGIPKDVWNMDSRAGAISEATEAGAPIDHARAFATHSKETQTVKYTRANKAKVDNVMKFRVDHRQKKLANTTETE